jgi:transmembrane sensor
MSGAFPNSAARAIDVEAEAAAWLRRRHFSAWNSEQQSALEEWLAQSVAHRVAYVRLEAAWTRTERLAALQIASPEQRGARRRTASIIGAAGALVLMAAVVTVAAQFFLNSGMQSYATALGGHRIVRLADGTRIELNTDTSIRARITQNSRTIWLDRGEAYFQVKHDAAHPFTVMASGRRLTDLGTKFLVRRDVAALRVAVLEGSVRVDADGAQKPATLTRGDVAVATANAVSVTRKPEEALASELGWREGTLIFDHTSLTDAAAEFNRYNRQKIVIAGADVARMTIGGTFRTSNVELFGRVAHDVLGLRVASGDDGIVISR